jgi:hypothetical protein
VSQISEIHRRAEARPGMEAGPAAGEEPSGRA